MCKQNKNKRIFIVKTKNDGRVSKKRKKERVHIRRGAECGGEGGGEVSSRRQKEQSDGETEAV